MDNKLEGRTELLMGDSTDVSPQNLRILRNNVLVKYVEQEKITPGGIILPECSQKVVDEGVVVRMGEITDPGCRDVGIEVGVRLGFNGLNARDLVLQNQNYAVVNVADIRGVIEDETAQVST